MYLLMESRYTSLNPISTERPKRSIVEWVRERDRVLLFPVVIDNELQGFRNFGYVTPQNSQCHHIHNMYHLKRFYPNTDANHPANLIMLERKIHARIHSDWIDRYQDVVKATDAGKPAWVDQYDEYFTGMAIVNTYDHMMETRTPYPDRIEQEIYDLYQILDESFVDRYRYDRNLAH